MCYNLELKGVNMKKKVVVKLGLNKKTVSNLDREEKKNIKGGVSIFVVTCDCKTDHDSCSVYINCCPPPEEVEAYLGE